MKCDVNKTVNISDKGEVKRKKGRAQDLESKRQRSSEIENQRRYRLTLGESKKGQR